MQATYKTTMEIGSLIRGSIISEIKEYCFRKNVNCEINEIRRGWISSTYTMKLTGEAYKLEAVKLALTQYENL